MEISFYFSHLLLDHYLTLQLFFLFVVARAHSDSNEVKKAAKQGNRPETDSALSHLSQAITQFHSSVRDNKQTPSNQQKINEALALMNILLGQVTNDARRAASGGSADIQAQRQLQQQLQALNGELDKLQEAQGGTPSVRALIKKNEINALLSGLSPSSSKDELFRAAELLSKAFGDFFKDIIGTI